MWKCSLIFIILHGKSYKHVFPQHGLYVFHLHPTLVLVMELDGGWILSFKMFLLLSSAGLKSVLQLSPDCSQILLLNQQVLKLSQLSRIKFWN